jgi:hypothetical protein
MTVPVDGGMQTERSDRYTPRRERIARLRAEREAEERDPLDRYRRERDAEEAAQRSQALFSTALEDALLGSRGAQRDPFFQVQEKPTAVERPLGPTPYAGVRHNDPYRSGTPANPSFGNMENAFDPYMSDSPLYRGFAHARYQGPLNPVFGLGQTTAKAFFRIPDVLHALPWDRGGPVGRTIDKGLAAWEQDLGSRIARDEAQEYVMRERHMTPLERTVDDLARFGLEFETAGRIAPILKAAPAVRAVPEGAGFLAREAAAAARLGRSAATQAAQFGSYELMKALLLPKLLKVPRRESPR